ncbi:PP2C family protein-serine/threonine phosphatase [Modestobacter sp. VKM Ac-2984]|uniref:PP2C family protein-serine/threonine phosphatase n=1 Tax=Modestobacter sp. VKM Ac-2984 TaxID=3004138 RepID=UPI0022AB22AD|nr:protein phosphatase 2C domain-containing protein [Modestobacter sp. VKM Ac-2984]MCZ2815532.1 protein phosphatase 2C domain-containing protein [Modestobacter sp. VKM Ac-2984]
MLVLDSAAVSTRGPRPDNQDSAVAGPQLIAIADGVGGNVGGAVASSLVVNWLAPLATGSTGEGADDPVRIVASANERIRAAYTERPRLRTMATTMTVLHVDAEGLALLHIGDSRGYLLQDGELQQVSTDHTLVQALIDAGSLTPAEAKVHPQRSAVYAALHGADDDVAAVDVLRLDARPGDRVMVCSDGLSDVVPPAVLCDLLAAEGTPAEAAARLRDAALAGPPTDNITVVVADVLEALPDGGPVRVCTYGAATELREETAEALEAVWPGPVPVGLVQHRPR